ncbi:cytochrome c biogenesis protein ResB [Herbiconiux sp. L3-i23]|nr:cytochrome c biogenesis protein ResB [Herbiconiux sp. L3-i23]
MHRPYDHITEEPDRPELAAPRPRARHRVARFSRWLWTELTSMRTALVLLLLLAIAAIPGSLVPQRSADPNGVVQYTDNNPQLAEILDALQVFDSYSSFWFSSIYLLLFISLIGCLVPRIRHHWAALRARPPRAPARFTRMPAHHNQELPSMTAETAAHAAERLLKRQLYRVSTEVTPTSIAVSAERGYIRETGNLVFHLSMVGVLIAVGLGGGFSYTGQRVLVEGEGFANTLSAYDSFNPGRFFTDTQLAPFALTLDDLAVDYETENTNAIGQPIDFTASVSTRWQGTEEAIPQQVKVNEPINVAGSDIFLLGNGYAPEITVTSPAGDVVLQEKIPFLPQDAFLTSLGIIKVPDGLAEQIGMIGFFYPTQTVGDSGAYFSENPDMLNPVLTLNTFTGDLGLEDGIPRSVYALDTSELTQLTGGDSGVDSIELRPGESAQLPNGLGTVALGEVPRFASFDISFDPGQTWVLIFSIVIVAGLLASLLIPRRRIWVRVSQSGDGVVAEYAGLARGDDPGLERVVEELATQHLDTLQRAGGGAMSDTPTHTI